MPAPAGNTLPPGYTRVMTPPPSPADRLARLVDDYLDALFSTYPTMAASLGLHQYDGRVPDFRERARASRLSALGGFAARLAEIPRDALDPDDRHDWSLLQLAIEEERFELDELRDVERNPLAYAGALDVSGYVKRSYAPPEVRIRALVEHLRQVPDVLGWARQLLRSPLPRPFVMTALEVYEGMVEFHDGDLPRAVREMGPGALWDSFERANAASLAALRDFRQHLEEELLPRATEDFALGEERFLTLIRLGEMVDLPLDRLLEIGEDDLARNAGRLREVASRLAPGVAIPDLMRRLAQDHPPADRLIDEAARVLEELRQFVEDHRLVSIPSAVRCRVEPTPPFARWAFAMMDTAGPFETAPESFYYVTLPDPRWPPEQVEAWLTKFDYATLRDVGIHEVYPGHYVHFLHLKQVPRRLRQVVTSYSFVEGWAHYCEEMMLEEGYRSDDLSLRLAQLSEALLRDVRFIAAVRMHTRGMGLEEATRLFETHAYLERLPAEKEAVRGTFDPGYLNYTLGKLMIRELRDEVRAAEGPAFSLGAFHDSLLGLGAPPVPLARWRLLGTQTPDL
jgi:uncharacterized protein (DUF885 family)